MDSSLAVARAGFWKGVDNFAGDPRAGGIRMGQNYSSAPVRPPCAGANVDYGDVGVGATVDGEQTLDVRGGVDQRELLKTWTIRGLGLGPAKKQQGQRNAAACGTTCVALVPETNKRERPSTVQFHSILFPGASLCLSLKRFEAGEDRRASLGLPEILAHLRTFLPVTVNAVDFRKPKFENHGHGMSFASSLGADGASTQGCRRCFRYASSFVPPPASAPSALPHDSGEGDVDEFGLLAAAGDAEDTTASPLNVDMDPAQLDEEDVHADEQVAPREREHDRPATPMPPASSPSPSSTSYAPPPAPLFPSDSSCWPPSLSHQEKICGHSINTSSTPAPSHPPARSSSCRAWCTPRTSRARGCTHSHTPPPLPQAGGVSANNNNALTTANSVGAGAGLDGGGGGTSPHPISNSSIDVMGTLLTHRGPPKAMISAGLTTQSYRSSGTIRM
ncbi:hypothetical protein C8F04DRAFT_1239303 [Mycena alexandri]|uniref:Uncharacterized protein n=1 Tax=Mycena alexandri TaxID=1745969 RepID=A0AAD6WVR1_9AGAR|nr:hypothetical protein C8F04DRAFT_1239303 [Mycena alexandri]